MYIILYLEENKLLEELNDTRDKSKGIYSDLEDIRIFLLIVVSSIAIVIVIFLLYYVGGVY